MGTSNWTPIRPLHILTYSFCIAYTFHAIRISGMAVGLWKPCITIPTDEAETDELFGTVLEL